MSAPRPARPNERFPWAVVTAASRPGRNSLVVAGAEEGQFAVIVALARRRSVQEVTQLLAPPLAPRDALRRVRDALAEPPRAARVPPDWRGGARGGNGGVESVEAGGGAAADEGDAQAQDGLPPVPQMQVGGWRAGCCCGVKGRRALERRTLQRACCICCARLPSPPRRLSSSPLSPHPACCPSPPPPARLCRLFTCAAPPKPAGHRADDGAARVRRPRRAHR